jgi:hypothetical protein
MLITYQKFEELNPNELLPILNKKSTRAHLMSHDLFDFATASSWIQTKVKVDSTHGCKSRAILVDGKLAGWCGIQPEDTKYEIAIVIDDKYWGIGKVVFKQLMAWCKEFGHKSVLIHFLHTRPEYRFLCKLATHVYQSELFGEKFTTYELTVK